MIRSHGLLACLAALVVVACVSTRAGVDPTVGGAKAAWVEEPDTADRVRITIVGTNDLHGWIEPHERTDGAGKEAVLGGTDAFAGYMNILRAKRPDGVVLLDAGDIFQGTLVVNMTEGQSVINAYNLLRYDAVALGNHEFDYGPEGDPVIALTPAEDPLGNIKKRIANAHFPFLVGNVFDRKTGKPVQWENARRSMLLERKGVRVGVIGLSTPLTPSVTLRQNVEGLEFKQLAPTAVELAKELRERGAQVIVLVMHAGGGCNHASDPKDTASCDTPGEIFPLLKEIPEGTVDAVIAGHTHQYLSHFVNGVPSIQSSSFGVAFGAIELVFDRTKKAVDQSATKIWKPVPLCRKVFASTGTCDKTGSGALEPVSFMGEALVPDETVALAMRPDIKMVELRKNEDLGPVLERPFGRSRLEESALGDLVADVMKETVPGVHVAFTNSGGLRADLNVGPLSYGDVFNALPFENRLAHLKVTGKELLAILRQGVSGAHGIIQVSGVTMEVAVAGTEKCTSDGARLLSAKFADGSPIIETETYEVVTNDFVAGGGDGFDVVLKDLDSSRNRVRNDLPPLREVVATWLRLHPEVNGPKQQTAARISFARAACAPASASATP